MNIYNLLNKIIINEPLELSAVLFNQEDRNNLDEDDKELFDILKNISSLNIEIQDQKIIFSPGFEFNGKNRSFNLEDLTEYDYEKLMSIDFDKIPPVLGALLLDILWTQKNDFKAAQKAIEIYWNLFQIWYNLENRFGAIDMFKRALCISFQTKQTSVCSQIYSWTLNYLTNDALNDRSYFPISLIELILQQKEFEHSCCLKVLDNIIKEEYINFTKVEKAYKLKTKCLHILKKPEEIKDNNIALAEYFVQYSENAIKENIRGVLLANDLLRKAINIYRENGEKDLADKTHRKLLEIQKEIPKTMVSISTEIKGINIKKFIEKNMNGLNFEESIIRLTQMLRFESCEDIEKKVIENSKNFSSSSLFSRKVINEFGQTIAYLPALDLQNPYKDKNLLNRHMFRYLSEEQSLRGKIIFEALLSYIRESFTFDKSMLGFLVDNNPIIPKGRESIFQSGIYMFLRGDFYESLHILAPQMENLFRNIAKEVGAVTVTLGKDGISNEKVLSSIFTLPEMLECYDNGILFVFRGLLNERTGANIRNNIAHGIFEEVDSGSGVCLYFGVAVIKLLTYTSNDCFNIYKNCKRLHNIEPLEMEDKSLNN